MIRTIRLTLADMDEAEAPRTIDDERRWPGNIESGQPQAVVDAIALDDRTIRIDQDRKAERMGTEVVTYFLRTLADDDQYLSPSRLILRKMGLQLFQLLAAVRSPGPSDEYDDGCVGAQHVDESNLFSRTRAQRKRRRDIPDRQGEISVGHQPSSLTMLLYPRSLARFARS